MGKVKVYAAAHAISLTSADGKLQPKYYKSVLADSIMKNTKRQTLGYEFANKIFNGPYYNLKRFFDYCRQNNHGRYLFNNPRDNTELMAYNFEPYVNMQGGDLLQKDFVTITFLSTDMFVRAYIHKHYPLLVDLPFTYVGSIPDAKVGGTVNILTSKGQYPIVIPKYNPSQRYLYLEYKVFNTTPAQTITKTLESYVSDFKAPSDSYVLISSELKDEPVTRTITTVTTRKYSIPELDEVPEVEVETVEDTTPLIKEVFNQIEKVPIEGTDDVKEVITEVTHVTNYTLEDVVTERTRSGETFVDGVKVSYTDTIKTTEQEIKHVRVVITKVDETTDKALVRKDTLIYERNSGNAALDKLFTNRQRSGFTANFIMLKKDGHYYNPNGNQDSVVNFNKTALKRWFKDTKTYPKLINEISKGDASQVDNMSLFPCIDTGKNDHATLMYLFHTCKYFIDRFDIRPNVLPKKVYGTSDEYYKYEKYVGGDVGSRTITSVRTKPNGTFYYEPNIQDAEELCVVGDNISYAVVPKLIHYKIGNGRYKHNGKELKVGEIRRINPLIGAPTARYFVINSNGITEDTTSAFQSSGSAGKPRHGLLKLPWNVSTGRSGGYMHGVCNLVYQIDDNRWEYVEFYFGGAPMVRLNWMYGGMEVHTTDTSDGIVGYVMPIIEDIYLRMPIIHANDVAMNCPYVLAHSWKRVKKKWYQTGLFVVVIVVVAIILAYFTGGQSLTAAGGILGSNAAVGAAIGLAGTAAVVAGFIINTVAAMIVANIIKSVSSKILGEQFGAIVSIVAMYVLSNWDSLSSGEFNIAESFNEAMNMENLYKMTFSAANMVTEKIQADTNKMLMDSQFNISKLKELEKEAVKKLSELDSSYLLNPIEVTEALNQEIKIEHPTAFINRTLMIGSALINTQMSMIEDFVDINLTLETSIDPFEV